MKSESKKNNFLQLEEKFSSIEKSKIIFLPLEYSDKKKKDETHPSKLIIEASKKLEKYDEEMNRELAYESGICSLNKLKVYSNSNQNGNSIDEISNIVKNKKLFTLSDDINTIKFLVDLYGRNYKEFTILHLDAKARMKNNPLPNKDSVIRNLVENNNHILQVGVRSLSKDEEIFKTQNLVKQILACEINLGMLGEDWQEIVVRNLNENVFIVLNINVFDPQFFDNISEPEPAGLNWNDLIYLFKIIGQDKNIIGADVNGIFPRKRSNSNYYIAKLIYKIMNYAIKK
ncbi:MAG: arginase family protein [Stygiobacter sp.]